MKRRFLNALVAGIASTALAACGVSTPQAQPSPVATSPTPTSSPPPNSPSTTSTVRCLGSCTSVPAKATAGKPDSNGTVTFMTPSGNIGCDVYMGTSGNFADCAILNATYVFPHRPDEHLDCEGLAVGAGPGGIMCRGDVMQWQIDQQARTLNVLLYGTSLTVGPFVCHSAVTALSCWRTTTGHGFALSRQAYSTW